MCISHFNNKIIMKSSFIQKLIIAASLIGLCSTQALAAGITFYYKVTAEAKPTGYGKVYLSTTNETPTDDQYSSRRGTGIKKENVSTQVEAITRTAYLWAKPEEGYMFTHWTSQNLKTGAETPFSWSKRATDIFTTASTTSDEAKAYQYNAHFAKIGKVYPVSSDEGLGTVMIDIPENKVGDEVTLTAQPDQLAGRFLGWRKDNSSTLTNVNPYSLKVTDSNSGTYTAVFEAKEISTKGTYCYVRNNNTNRLLGVTGSSESTLSDEQREFKHSMMMVPNTNPRAHAIPSLVIKIMGESTQTGSLENVEMITQGISTYDLNHTKFRVARKYDGSYYIFGQYEGVSLYINDRGNTTRKFEFIGDVRTPSLYNRYEEETYSRWYLDIIDADDPDNYFGAMPDAKCNKGSYYYTTLYTPFPYECLDGVKAYTVDMITEDGRPHLAEIKGGKVPANTAVVLECSATQPINNRLMPLTEDIEPLTGINMLKGEIWLEDESGDEANYRTPFDPASMRVLGDGAKFVNTNLTDPVSGKVLTYIANNSCYLDLSGEENPPATLDFTKIDGSLKGDADGSGLINMTDVTTVINYILTKPVTKFVFVNADVNEDGKINMTDVTGIISIILGR